MDLSKEIDFDILCINDISTKWNIYRSREVLQKKPALVPAGALPSRFYPHYFASSISVNKDYPQFTYSHPIHVVPKCHSCVVQNVQFGAPYFCRQRRVDELMSIDIEILTIYKMNELELIDLLRSQASCHIFTYLFIYISSNQIKIPIINSCTFVTKHFHNISITIAFQLKKNELFDIST